MSVNSILYPYLVKWNNFPFSKLNAGEMAFSGKEPFYANYMCIWMWLLFYMWCRTVKYFLFGKYFYWNISMHWFFFSQLVSWDRNIYWCSQEAESLIQELQNESILSDVILNRALEDVKRVSGSLFRNAWILQLFWTYISSVLVLISFAVSMVLEFYCFISIIKFRSIKMEKFIF